MHNNKLKIYGFNNLTKTLSFNIYNICYTLGKDNKQHYIAYIDGAYNAMCLTEIFMGATCRLVNYKGHLYCQMVNFLQKFYTQFTYKPQYVV